MRLLVVEEDPAARAALAALLAADGHTVETAATGRAGWERFRAAGAAYDAVLAALDLPDVSGGALAAACKQLAPALPVVLVTGPGAAPGAARVWLPCVDAVLATPATPEALREALATAQARVAGAGRV